MQFELFDNSYLNENVSYILYAKNIVSKSVEQHRKPVMPSGKDVSNRTRAVVLLSLNLVELFYFSIPIF